MQHRTEARTALLAKAVSGKAVLVKAVLGKAVLVKAVSAKAVSVKAVLVAALLMGAVLGGTAVAQSLPRGAEQPAPERYRDVPDEHWAADAVRKLSTLGILTGYPDDSFRGEISASRYELALVAARLIDLIAGPLEDLEADPAFRSESAAGADLSGRVRRTESILENAASLDSVRELARRVADIEAYLNEQIGEDRFPLDTDPDWEPTSAVEAAAAAEPEASGGSQGATEGEADPDFDPAFGVAASGLRRPLGWWIGLSAGHPLPVTVHVGLRDLLPSLHLRGGASFGGTEGFGLELIALYGLPVSTDAAILPYLGGGPSLRSGGGSGGGSGSGSGSGGGGAAGGLTALAGLEIPLGRSMTEPGFLYLEIGGEVVFSDGSELGLLGRAGLAYRF